MKSLVRLEKQDMTTNKEIPVEKHPLEPFLPSNGKLLMLGSFPPQKKRWSMEFYYPNFTNDMWRLFGVVFFNDAFHFVDKQNKTYKKQEIIDFLNAKGIGLYDTASSVRRLQDNASDKYLEIVTPTDIESLLERMPGCRAIVTTGQKATDTICQHFNIEQPKMTSYAEFIVDGNTFRLYRMPSTSRAYPLALAKKAEAYQTMFREVLGL